MVEEIIVEGVAIREVETGRNSKHKETGLHVMDAVETQINHRAERHNGTDLHKADKQDLTKDPGLNNQDKQKGLTIHKVSRQEMRDQTSRDHLDLSNKDRINNDLLKTGHRSNPEIIPRRNQINKFKNLSIERFFLTIVIKLYKLT